jgi:hypothetical protein
MSDTVQDAQKLLTDTIRKQMTILGPQITLLKAHNVTGLTIKNDGSVTAVSGNPGEVITRFLEQFRDLSSPLVKKTMKPLLSAVSTPLSDTTQVHATPENSEHSENRKI